MKVESGTIMFILEASDCPRLNTLYTIFLREKTDILLVIIYAIVNRYV